MTFDMKNIKRIGLVLLVACIPLEAFADAAKIYVKNELDSWAWVTVRGRVSHWYGSGIENLDAWCVDPGAYVKRGPFAASVSSVQVELGSSAGCGHVFKNMNGSLGNRNSNTLQMRLYKKRCGKDYNEWCILWEFNPVD